MYFAKSFQIQVVHKSTLTTFIRRKKPQPGSCAHYGKLPMYRLNARDHLLSHPFLTHMTSSTKQMRPNGKGVNKHTAMHNSCSSTLAHTHCETRLIVNRQTVPWNTTVFLVMRLFISTQQHNKQKNLNKRISVYVNILPHAGSGVVRIDALRFLTGCRTRRLNQA